MQIARSEFPVEYLPPLVKKAVLDMQKNTQFPLPLIVSSALSAVSLACQNSIDVQQPIGSVSPCSLFMLLVADSGEGKTPTDNYFTKPIRDFEENQEKKLADELVQQKTLRSAWDIERQAIENAMKKNRKKSLSTDQADDSEALNLELENLQKKFKDHLLKEPKQQRQYRLMVSNITPEKLLSDLNENWPSVGLFSNEAGSLFRSGAMRNLGMLNQLWDGAPLSVDRVSSPSFKVNNARLSVSLMVQGQVMENFLAGRGKEARDIGFLARYLVACPLTTKGSRFVDDRTQSWHHLTAFQQRITEILTQDKLEVDQGRQARRVLVLSPEAKCESIKFRNEIESHLTPGGYYSDVDDFASKIANNLARMAALFHFFEGHQADISAESHRFAEGVCVWYLNEYKRLFTKQPDIPSVYADAYDLEQSLLRFCQNHPGCYGIEKSKIAQYGPSQLRKDKVRRDAALYELTCQNKIYTYLIGKKPWIALQKYINPIPFNNTVFNPQPLVSHSVYKIAGQCGSDNASSIPNPFDPIPFR